MAHMGACSPDEMNGLHWQWHQRTPLRIRATMQRHNIWDIPGSPGYQGHPSGHRRPQSQDVPEPPRQAARRNSPERQRGQPAGMCSPSNRLPRGAAQTPQGCKPARQSSARRQGTLAAPAAAAARRLPRHGKSSSTRIPTEAMEVPTTPTPNGHHLPPIPDAGPRGLAPNGRKSRPFSRQPSSSDRQRLTQAPAGQQTERTAHPPPPSRGRWPALCWRDSTPRTHGRPKACTRGGGITPPTTPPASGAR